MIELRTDTVYLARVPVQGDTAPWESYRELALAALDGLDLDLPEDGTVCIKPNATVLYPADKRIITHPGFLAGLVESFAARGVAPSRIEVGDGQSGENPGAGHTWKLAGYADAIAGAGARLVPFNDTPAREVEVPGGVVFQSYPVYTAVTDCAFLVNAPLAKCHNLGCTTLAIKNLMGVLGRPERHLCTVQPCDEPLGEEALYRLGDSGLSVFEERFYHKLCDIVAAVRALGMPRLCVVDGLIGRDGTAFNEGENVSIQSSEMVERIYPLRVLRSELRPGSGGAGRHRGGLGLRREIRVEASEARLSILSDRNLVPPYGVNGGRSGAPNSYHVVSDGRAVAPSAFPGKVSDFPLGRGDVLVMESSGGGGYGPAAERTEAEIHRDLAEGYVGEADLAVYGARRRSGKLVRERPRDEMIGVRPAWLDGDALANHLCRPGEQLAAALGLRPGQTVELAAPTGPPLRFRVEGFEESSDTLGLGERWRDRLPDGPFVLRAMPTGTPSFVRGAT